MKFLFPILGILLHVNLSLAQVTLPKEIAGQPGQFIPITAETKSTGVYFYPVTPGLSVFPSTLLKDPKSTVVVGLVTGRYKIIAWDGPTSPAETIVVIGNVPPPGPGPKPDPPGPDNAPIPEKGLHVLMIYESADLPKYPKGQIAVLYSTEVQNYVNKVNGSSGYWRVWDKDVDTSKESKKWQDAFARPRQSLPWVIISNGTTGHEGPLPGTVAEMQTLLKKYER